MSLVVFGDSHAIACFARFTEARIYWLGPVTMHRVARDGAGFVREHVPESKSEDVHIFVFGEIDVRCHLAKAANNEESQLLYVVSSLAERYIDAINQVAKGQPGRYVVCSVIPPSDDYNDPQFPKAGSIGFRIQATRLLNEELRRHAASCAIQFLDIFERYADKRGKLKRFESDGYVHIGLDSTRYVKNQLESLINQRVGYRWGLWFRGVLLLPIRSLLTVFRPKALWRFNREYSNTMTKNQ